MKSHRYNSAVTLVEMLIVVAIVSLLATIVIGLATRIHAQGNERLTRNTIAMLESALEQYHDFDGSFPQGDFGDPNLNSESLYAELSAIPASRKILGDVGGALVIEDKDGTPGQLEIYDPWGTVINYEYFGGDTFPRLISAGPDRRFTTTDDIRSDRL